MHEIVRHAAEARRNAYAPYSGYAVGACVLGANGKLYRGCNVENASYGLTVCAERSAVVQMVGDGCKELLEVAVVTRDGATPCGMCLQTLAEFAIELNHVTVHCASAEGTVTTYQLHELLPHGFALGEFYDNAEETGESE